MKKTSLLLVSVFLLISVVLALPGIAKISCGRSMEQNRHSTENSRYICPN